MPNISGNRVITTPKSNTPAKPKTTGPTHTMNPSPTGWASGSKFSAAQASKAFWHSPYTNADAKAAQQKFKLPSIAAAKQFIGQAILNKSEKKLNDVGITRKNFDRQDCLAAFKRSDYSSSDVAEAKKKFDFLKGESDQSVKEYIGLKIVNKYETMLAGAGITPSKYDQHEEMAAFKRAGYTDADAKKAQKAWKSFLPTLQDAREYIGDKVISRNESLLREIGVTPSGKK